MVSQQQVSHLIYCDLLIQLKAQKASVHHGFQGFHPTTAGFLMSTGTAISSNQLSSSENWSLGTFTPNLDFPPGADSAFPSTVKEMQ